MGIKMKNKIEEIGYEKIDLKGLEIKPEWNIKWYNQKDGYSDGDIEDEIIGLIANREDNNYTEDVLNHFTWPTYYHLSPIRQDIVNWYPFKEGAEVLEIGCGLGAITEVLCEKCEKVTAVEMSKRRATATLLRCRQKENLEIIVGNLNDIRFEKTFDYITLIGVLEYQGSYTDGSNPYEDFLTKIKGLLKPDGKLIVAIENKFGLKYWCGAREDHTGLPFDGINQYKIGNKGVRTFSREELKNLLINSGFENTYFYYPLPDYKFPLYIYSENHLPKDTKGWAPYYVPNGSTLIADETKLYEEIIKNNVFEFFANSFLVECSVDSKELGEIELAILHSNREEQYRVGTIISKKKEVQCIPLNFASKGHLLQVYDNSLKMVGKGLNIVPLKFQGNKLEVSFMDCPSMEGLILDAYKAKETKKIEELFDTLLTQIEKGGDIETETKKNILYELEIDKEESGISYGKILKIGYVDMIPRNCFVKDGLLFWFDQEWKLENVPSKYILYRAIRLLYEEHIWIDEVFKMEELIRKYNMEACVESFYKLELMFINTVIDKNTILAKNWFGKKEIQELKINILKLLNQNYGGEGTYTTD